MNQEFEHLSDAQIENYGAPNHPAGEDQAVETHLAACAGCRTRLLTFHRTRLGLMIDLPVKAARRPDCPPEDSLRNLAAGIAPAADATRLTAHAAQCDYCGPILRAYFEDFSDDLSADEQALLTRAALSPARRQNIAQQLAAAVGVSASPAIERSVARGEEVAQPGSSASPVLAGRGGQPPSAVQKDAGPSLKPSLFRLPWFRWALVPATALACAIVAFFIWNSQRETPEKVEKLLAQAYTEQRTMEMRIPYAAHADFKQTRSGETASLLSSPEALRKATDAIAANLKKNPDDPKWLLLSARLDLLAWNYEPALSTLDRINTPGATDSVDFLKTRSLALFEKAETEKNSQGYFEAIELLGKALETTPNDTVVLFNQAIVCEKVSAYQCATTDWQHLLKVETNAGWSVEAREHLKQLEEKKNPVH